MSKNSEKTAETKVEAKEPRGQQATAQVVTKALLVNSADFAIPLLRTDGETMLIDPKSRVKVDPKLIDRKTLPKFITLA